MNVVTDRFVALVAGVCLLTALGVTTVVRTPIASWGLVRIVLFGLAVGLVYCGIAVRLSRGFD